MWVETTIFRLVEMFQELRQVNMFVDIHVSCISFFPIDL